MSTGFFSFNTANPKFATNSLSTTKRCDKRLKQQELVMRSNFHCVWVFFLICTFAGVQCSQGPRNSALDPQAPKIGSEPQVAIDFTSDPNNDSSTEQVLFVAENGHQLFLFNIEPFTLAKRIDLPEYVGIDRVFFAAEGKFILGV